MSIDASPYRVAFVLGGGGVLGAHEVGMLQALAESSITPDIVLGTSIGALKRGDVRRRSDGRGGAATGPAVG